MTLRIQQPSLGSPQPRACTLAVRVRINSSSLLSDSGAPATWRKRGLPFAAQPSEGSWTSVFIDQSAS